MVIREYEPSDAEALADFFARNLEGVLSAQGVEHAGDAFPARAHLANWVVPQDDGIAGWAYAHLKSAVDLGIGYLRVVVDPAARGGGIGSALWNRAVEHLSALQPRKLTTDVDDFPDSIAFIERRGFQATRRSIVSALDLRSASPPESELPGSLTLSLRRLAGREGEMFELFLAAERDVPADDPRGQLLTFADWERETLQHHDLSQDGSFFVIEHGRLLAFALLLVDHGRRAGWNEMTGTHPEHRGRGLATLAKSAAIRWARSNGIERILTNNDAENAPILAINGRLGYQPVKVLIDYERELE